MTSETHLSGGMFVSTLGFIILKQKGLLLPDCNEALQWLVMYPFTLWGSLASDLDHHSGSIPMRDIASRTVNAVLHITNPVRKYLQKHKTKGELEKSPLYFVANTLCAKHRSWQTHSDLTLIFILYVLYSLLFKPHTLGVLDHSILVLVLTGTALGVLAHLVLDAFTTDGIWLIGVKVLNCVLSKFNPRKKCFLKKFEKLHLVPSTHFFSVDGVWERCVCKLLKLLTILSTIYLIYLTLLPYIQTIFPYKITFNF